jgi:hypothetical protein
VHAVAIADWVKYLLTGLSAAGLRLSAGLARLHWLLGLLLLLLEQRLGIGPGNGQGAQGSVDELHGGVLFEHRSPVLQGERGAQ